MTRNEITERLGISHPILQAPMAGGTTTPELVAAVSNAGALGSLGAAYLTPEQLIGSIQKIRALTDRPFNVNLFAGGYEAEPKTDPGPMLAFLAEVHEILGLPAPTLPTVPSDPFPEQLQAVIEARPPVFSFTFGIPHPSAMRSLKACGITVLGAATVLREASMLAEAGVDGIVAQGAEAGAHRGTFAGPFEEAMVPSLELVEQIATLRPLPVIASGGLMDGHDIADAMDRGASAAQLGTAFLTCPESGASSTHKEAVLAAGQDTTLISRAFSGRPARALMNTFLSKLATQQEIILPFPLQNRMTRPMRMAAAKLGNAGFLSLWAGQGVTRARSMPAATLVQCLVEEINAVSGMPRG